MFLLVPDHEPGNSTLTPEEVAEVMGISVEAVEDALKHLQKVNLVHGELVGDVITTLPNGFDPTIYTYEHDSWDEVADGWEQIDPVKRYGIHPGYKYN